MEVKKLTAKHKMFIKLNTIRNHLKVFIGKRKMFLIDYNQTFINKLTDFWEQNIGLQPNTIHKNFRFIVFEISIHQIKSNPNSFRYSLCSLVFNSIRLLIETNRSFTCFKSICTSSSAVLT